MKTSNFCIFCIFCIVCIAFIVCIPVLAPAQVKDNFSDGDFTENPAWAGDAGHFEVNLAGQLHLFAAGSDTSLMVTRNDRVIETEWSFWMKLSFNTSSNNFARVYLMSDTTALASSLNGYFLQVGGGDDSVFIVKQTGLALKTIYRFRSYKTFHSTNTVRFKVTRDEAGRWEALIDTTGGYKYFQDGTFFEDSFVTTRWFGLMCRYTSSNATKFYFDDFYIGPVLYDTIRPGITSMEALSANVLRISFSEAIQRQPAENVENYQLKLHGIRPDSVILDLSTQCHVSLFLHDSLAEGTFDSLRVVNIADISGNLMRDTLVQVCYYRPKAYDILIDEIMADPDPPVELPNGEFVELYNRSAFPINLKDWTFKYGSYIKSFPSITLSSGGYLLIVKDSAFLHVANCAVLFTSSSSLSNEGTTLILKDPGGHVIHTVTYSPGWYRGSFKEEGGWSLEMTDPLNPCGCMDNWGPSTDAFGGTPGRANSSKKTNADETAPVVLRAVITDSARLSVTFSEAMDSLSMLAPSKWITFPSGKHPVGVQPVAPDFSSALLSFNELFEHGIIYNLRLSGTVKDCARNECDTTRSIRFAFPDSVAARDVVINEVLTNPASGGSRFIELFNRSEKIIDLQTLVLSNRDTLDGFSENAVSLTSVGYLLFPGDYIAFTSSREEINDRYPVPFPENIAGVSGFPVFGDDTGTVIVARKDNLMIVDRMQYTAEMHYPLLATTEGVSLERTSPDWSSEDQNNWHSAAETVGFATPGYQNSHWVTQDVTDQEIFVYPEIFSPDNDGRDDLLIVTIRLDNPDFAVNMRVFDSRGRFVRQITNNVFTGSEGVFTWDGMSFARTRAPLGMYILLVELVRPDGVVRKIKRTVVLGGAL